MARQELAIKLNCPRAYETATKYWEDSGVEDHCAGCGGTKAEHIEESNRIIQEQSDKELEIDYTCCDCGEPHIRPFDNGDGKTRCEPCAVAHYKKNPLSMVKIIRQPAIQILIT